MDEQGDSKQYSKYVAMLEYDGSNYCGWQRLSHAVAVQNRVEAAISKVANHPIEVVCAGRTDSGVHALGQVIHFESWAQRDAKAWLLGCNTNLPDDIAIQWIKPIDKDFHARFSATARRYRYIILNRKARPALLKKKVTWIYSPLDAEAMHQAAQCLLGEHDFSSFRASGCQAAHANRCLSEVNVSRQGDYIYVDVKGNAFLHHMVRNIVGALLEVGRAEKPIGWIADLLALKDRRQGGVTASAEGLYFVEVDYPECFDVGNGKLFPIYQI